MDHTTTSMKDIAIRLIQGGRLTKEQEAAVREYLGLGTYPQDCKSLRGCTDQSADKKGAGMEADRMKEMHDRIYGRCIWGNSTGNIDFSEAMKEKYGIERPYEGEDLEKIAAWLEENPEDVRGLAVAFWLLGEISAKEMVNLRPSDLVSCSDEDAITIRRNTSVDTLLLTPERKRIIHAALNLYNGRGKEYVFMVKDRGKLRKLSEVGLLGKLAAICRQVDVMYKAPIKCTDRIIWSL